MITGVLASSALVAVPGVANAQCVSDRYSSDTISTNKGLVLQGVGDAGIHRNYGGGTVSYAVTSSGSGTSTWSVNAEVGGTAGYDFAVIKASVSIKVGGSHTTSRTATGSTAVTLSIPSNYYGIVQYGVQRRYTVGTYVYDNGYCTVTTRSVYTKLPVTTNGSASVVNSTGNVPWDHV